MKDGYGDVTRTVCHIDGGPKNPFIHPEEAVRWQTLSSNTSYRGVGEWVGLQKYDVYNFSG